MRLMDILVAAVLLAISAGVSAQAVPKIYLNPSDQTGNWSPDRTYCEADGMQDVARRLEAKLKARGFDVRNSNGATMRESVDTANAWPADVFISLHSNAAGSKNSGKAHGTNTLFFFPRDGREPNPISIKLAVICDEKVVEKMTTYGRGHDFAVTPDFPFLPYNLYVLRRTEMPGTLVEGLFHDNMEDVAVLKTEEGRDAYAQGVYEALCDHFGWSYYPDAPIFDPVGPVANDSVGNLVLVVRGEKGNASVIRQTGVNARWQEEWTDLEGELDGEPVIARNAQERLQVFAVSGGRVRHKVQAKAGSDRWNGWYDLGGNTPAPPVVARNADGRLVVFAIGSDGHLRYRMQRSVESAIQWDGWQDMGGGFSGRPAVCTQSDGATLVVCWSSRGLVWAEQAGSMWSKWIAFDVADPRNRWLVVDGHGDPALLCHAADGSLLYLTRSGGRWSAAQNLGHYGGRPAAVLSTDGRLELFAADARGELFHNTQDAPGGKWTAWQPLAGVNSFEPVAGRNRDGRIEVFARDKEGKMKYRIQREPGKSAIWDGWYTVGEYFKAKVRDYKQTEELSQ